MYSKQPRDNILGTIQVSTVVLPSSKKGKAENLLIAVAEPTQHSFQLFPASRYPEEFETTLEQDYFCMLSEKFAPNSGEFLDRALTILGAGTEVDAVYRVERKPETENSNVVSIANRYWKYSSPDSVVYRSSVVSSLISNWHQFSDYKHLAEWLWLHCQEQNLRVRPVIC